MLLHTAVYAGVPAANAAFAVAQRVLARPGRADGGPGRGRRLVERSPDFVQSLERGLAVIRAFDRSRPELTLSEVAAATGVTRAAARRFLLTLAELGYVRTDGRFFSLSPRVLELGYAYLSSLTPARGRRAAPGGAGRRGERVVVGVGPRRMRHRLRGAGAGIAHHDGGDQRGHALPRVRHVDGPGAARRADRRRAGALPRRAGACSGSRRGRWRSAKALRAEIQRVRTQGWSLVDQELEEGLRSVAAPIRDRTGRTVAAVNVSAHASRTSLESMRRDLVPPLLAAAARISADLPASGRR